MKILLKIIGGIIAIPIIGLLLFTLARVLFCGPNKEVIKVVKPVLQIIADDIVKHNTPVSLSSIENLPYKLENCRREVVLKTSTTIPTSIVDKQEDADFAIISEGCTFKKGNKSYPVNLWFTENYDYKEGSQGHIRVYDGETYTGLYVSFNVNKGSNTYSYHSIGDGYAKHHGVLCGSFKQ